jgi:hypothetical protein
MKHLHLLLLQLLLQLLVVVLLFLLRLLLAALAVDLDAVAAGAVQLDGSTFVTIVTEAILITVNHNGVILKRVDRLLSQASVEPVGSSSSSSSRR